MTSRASRVLTLVALAGSTACALSASRTALGQAVLDGDATAVRAYLARGGDPNRADGVRGMRLLSLAARASNVPAMEALVAAGADPNLRDEAGNRWVPLMHAIHKHRVEPVQFLLQHGAQADGPDGLPMTPLMMAVAAGETQSVRLLLDHGASAQRRLPDGSSIMTLALSGGALTDIDEPILGECHFETVRLLKERAPDARAETGTLRGRVARLFARLNGCGEAIAIADQ
jgi:ankyrin repeat protein